MNKDFSAPVQAVYGACVDKLLQNIARHLNNAFAKGQWGSLDWDAHVLHEMGQLTQNNIKVIAAATQDGAKLTEQAVGQAIMDALASTAPDLKAGAAAGVLVKPDTYKLSASMNGILKAYSGQAAEQANLVNTVMLESSKGAMRRVVSNVIASQKVLRETTQGVLNTATGEVLTGVSGLQAAVRDAVKQLVDGGITGFVDKAGRMWSPEAYVGMDVRTTAASAAMDAVMEQNKQYGVDMVIVPVNATARPKCAPFQGMVLSMSGGSGVTYDRDGNTLAYRSINETTYGEPDGLFGINCHHRPPDPFVPGVSKQKKRPPDDVAERYEQTQKQRKLERDVKKAKREAVCFDTVDDKAGFAEAAEKVNRRMEKLKAYCDANDLPFYGDRVQVYGYNRSVSAKATAAVKRLVSMRPVKPVPEFLSFNGRREADDYLRPVSGKIWKALTPEEKEAVYKYTAGSGGFNRPLRGYDRYWEANAFKGVGNVPLDNENRGEAIKHLSEVLARNELPSPMTLYRDSDHETLELLLGMPRGSARGNDAVEVAQEFVGRKVIDHGFLSASACEDSSFGYKVTYVIKAPKGTKGMYVEPMSHYNEMGNHGVWDGESGADRLGNEMEIILQKGGTYKINKIYEGTEGRSKGRLTVEMEVIIK